METHRFYFLNIGKYCILKYDQDQIVGEEVFR